MSGIHAQNFKEILIGIKNIMASGFFVLTDWFTQRLSKDHDRPKH